VATDASTLAFSTKRCVRASHVVVRVAFEIQTRRFAATGNWQGVKSDIALIWMVENGCFTERQLKEYYPGLYNEARERVKARQGSSKHE
jgi:hypothetical protein